MSLNRKPLILSELVYSGHVIWNCLIDIYTTYYYYIILYIILYYIIYYMYVIVDKNIREMFLLDNAKINCIP